jgi:adenosine deaminase
MIDLDLTEEYLLTAAAFDLAWDDLVALAVDGVEASWLDESDKRQAAARVRAGATQTIPGG